MRSRSCSSAQKTQTKTVSDSRRARARRSNVGLPIGTAERARIAEAGRFGDRACRPA